MLDAGAAHLVQSACGTLLESPRLRRYAPVDLHLTLFFLGATAPERVPALEAALAEAAAAHAAPELVIGRAGAFPGRGRERVLWLDVGGPGTEQLERLQRDVAARMPALGFAPDARPWRAHLTLARVRDGRGAAAVPDAFFALDPGIPWKPTELALVESLAGRANAPGAQTYRALARFPFAR